MPVFTFHGIDDATVKEYFKSVGELAQITNIDIENFVFFNQNATIIGNGYDADAIYVTIDWIGRPLKQEPVAKHVTNFFANRSQHIYVRFNEINSFMYLNGKEVNY